MSPLAQDSSRARFWLRRANIGDRHTQTFGSNVRIGFTGHTCVSPGAAEGVKLWAGSPVTTSAPVAWPSLSRSSPSVHQSSSEGEPCGARGCQATNERQDDWPRAEVEGLPSGNDLKGSPYTCSTPLLADSTASATANGLRLCFA